MHEDDIFSFVTPPAKMMDMSRSEAWYPSPWYNGKDEQPVDCLSACTVDRNKLGRPVDNLLEEVSLTFM